MGCSPKDYGYSYCCCHGNEDFTTPAGKKKKTRVPHVGLEPTTVRLRVVSATDCASEATSLKADSHGFPSEENANYDGL